MRGATLMIRRFLKTPVQEPLIPESYASESVVAWAMHQKYQNGLPLKATGSRLEATGCPIKPGYAC